MKTARIILLLLLCMALLCSCGGKEKVKDVSGRYYLNEVGNEAVIDDVDFSFYAETSDNSRVFYEIFVGAFSDSDGDGIGDLRGIINRFDYLNDGDPKSGLSLGVEGIWLMPIFKSPSYHKYDVTDYYKIDPSYGTEADLKELIDLCHERNVKLIIDLPINHTGYNNLWFTQFTNAHKSGDTSNEYYEFYCYSDTASVAGRTFARLNGTAEYYECNFSTDMPELNFDNDAVRKAVLDVADYYIALGIDGFRFDAAKYVYYGNEEKSASFWEWYCGELRNTKPDIYTVAEVWAADSITNKYYPATDCFDFTMSQTSGRIAETARMGNVNNYTSYVSAYLKTIGALRSGAMIIPFIANHDTDRAAGFMTLASGYAQVAANLYILSPGSPFIYYGEEIGLKGSRGSSNTDANRRLAMLWGDGDTVKDPVGATYDPASQTNGTVASEAPDGDSLYNYYKRLIMIRKANPEIAHGSYTALNISGSKLGGFISEYEGNSVMVLHNTLKSAVTVDLSTLSPLNFGNISAIIGIESAELSGTTLTIGAQTSVVLRAAK